MRMLLKLDNLTNLADARYGAALGVDYLCFSLERGSMYKLSALALREMLPWLSGPQVVLALGEDVAQAETAEPLAAELGLVMEYDLMALAESDHRPALPYALQLTLQPGRLAATYPMELLVVARYLALEADPNLWTAETLAATMEALKTQLPVTLPLFFRTDGWPSDELLSFTRLCNGLAYGQKLDQGFSQLDYDCFEAILERFEPERIG